MCGLRAERARELSRRIKKKAGRKTRKAKGKEQRSKEERIRKKAGKKTRKENGKEERKYKKIIGKIMKNAQTSCFQDPAFIQAHKTTSSLVQTFVKPIQPIVFTYQIYVWPGLSEGIESVIEIVLESVRAACLSKL